MNTPFGKRDNHGNNSYVSEYKVRKICLITLDFNCLQKHVKRAIISLQSKCNMQNMINSISCPVLELKPSNALLISYKLILIIHKHTKWMNIVKI